MMHGRGKSDGLTVPKKSPNEGWTTRSSGSGDAYTGTKAETPDTDKAKPGSATARPNRPEEEMEGKRPAEGNPIEFDTSRTQSRNGVPSALERIRQAARRDKSLRFTALLHHVYDTERLRTAYEALRRNAAAGVDGVTWRAYGENLEENLRDLSSRLSRGAYRAIPARRTYIPKADGRLRPLGVPALEDKIVQRALVEVLNAIYETEFLGFSHGFRPGRSPHQALDALAMGIEKRRVNWIIDADIRDFFGTIDHEWLVKFLEHRIADRRVVRLVRKWLTAGVLEEGRHIPSEQGTVQGGSISPLLANLYLHHALDLWVRHWRRTTKADVIFVRFADDYVAGFESCGEAERFRDEMRERLSGFGLSLHEGKTRLIEFGRYAAARRRTRGLGKPETFDFLGFTHICARSRNGWFRVLRKTSSTRLHAKLGALKTELARRRHQNVRMQGVYLRSVVLGHFRYYGVPLNRPSLYAFRRGVRWLWLRSIARRSQKGRRTVRRAGPRLTARWLPEVQIFHPYPSERLFVTTRGKSRMR